MSPRLMIVAEDPLSASMLRRALRATPALSVLDGYVDAGASFTTALATHAPDVVVVDQMSSRNTTIKRVGEIRTELPRAKIVLLQDEMDSDWLRVASTVGADAAIAKTFAYQGIGVLIREMVAGNVFHSFQTARGLARPAADSDLSQLTERELEILRLAAAGSPNSRIAARLWITEQTVKFHLSNVYRKLGVANRTEASHIAYVEGLLELTPTTLASAETSVSVAA